MLSGDGEARSLCILAPRSEQCGADLLLRGRCKIDCVSGNNHLPSPERRDHTDFKPTCRATVTIYPILYLDSSDVRAACRKDEARILAGLIFSVIYIVNEEARYYQLTPINPLSRLIPPAPPAPPAFTSTSMKSGLCLSLISWICVVYLCWVEVSPLFALLKASLSPGT